MVPERERSPPATATLRLIPQRKWRPAYSALDRNVLSEIS
jgi:hypothetical protein